LTFNLGRPLSINFLRRNSKAGDVSAEHHNLAKLALEASFTEYEMATVMPSVMGAASLLLALRVIDS
jgi:cyclin B